VVLSPFVHRLEVDLDQGRCGGVPGVWYRPRDRDPVGTILYLHGGGYVGTSPLMYAAFTGYLAHATHCEVFVADYRLAPEFPFPAALLDAIDVFEGMLDRGVKPEKLVVAGDSGGGGLVTSLLQDARAQHLPAPACCVLFSPEVDLALDEPSVTENAGLDILPRHIPVEPYLAGHDAHDGLVSAIYADLHRFPPTLVAFGDEEMFRDPIREFVDLLRADGVSVDAIEEPEMFHMYPILMPWAEASHRLYRELGRFVGSHLVDPDAPAAEPIE
jgi:acetyl esterase/lipase